MICVCLWFHFSCAGLLAGIQDPRDKVSQTGARAHEGHLQLQRGHLSSQDALFPQGTAYKASLRFQLWRGCRNKVTSALFSSRPTSSAPDGGRLVRGGLAAVHSGLRGLHPRRHGRVHPHGDPAAEARCPNKFTLLPRKHSATWRRKRTKQEKKLAAPEWAGWP